MRISDWSSDVCSSDLPSRIAAAAILALGCAMPAASRAVAIDRGASPPADAVAIPKGSREKAVKELPHIIDRVMRRSHVPGMADRKSVVEGKSVSVRVELGGCRNIKKKKTQTDR